jgi:alpha-glucosidase
MTEQQGMRPEQALESVIATTRDGCRSPFQWSSAPNAGFSPPGVTTWLPVSPNYAVGINVAAQEADPASLLSFYRRMLQLRRATPALIAGDYHALHPHSEAYLAFLRHDDATGQTCLVALNFSSEEQTAIFDLGARQPRLLFSSRDREGQPLALDLLSLAPFEILIAELA